MKEDLKLYYYMGRSLDLKAADCRMDLDTSFEKFIALIAIIILFFLGWLVYFNQPEESMWLTFGAFIIAIIVHRFTDFTYFINNVEHSLDYSWSIFGLGRRYTVCSFDEIDSVSTTSEFVSGYSRYWFNFYYQYNVVIVKKTGKTIRVTDKYEEGLKICNELAKRLALHFGARYLPGQIQRQVCVKAHRGSKELNVSLESNLGFFRWLLIRVVFVAICVALIYAGEQGYSLPPELYFLRQIEDIDLDDFFGSIAKSLKNLW